MCVISSIVILSRVSSDLGVAAPLALFMRDLVVEHNGLDEGYHSLPASCHCRLSRSTDATNDI